MADAIAGTQLTDPMAIAAQSKQDNLVSMMAQKSMNDDNKNSTLLGGKLQTETQRADSEAKMMTGASGREKQFADAIARP